MLKNKRFNSSLLFSFACHIICLSAICVVITPTVKLQNKYIDINFLGPILEKTAFDIIAEGSAPRTETLYQASIISEDESILINEGPGRMVKKGESSINDYLKKSMPVADKKGNPKFSVKQKNIFYHLSEKGINKFIEGPAKLRAVIFKPRAPSFLCAEDSFVIKLKFMLSEEGIVENVEPVTSSGFPMIDITYINYLKQWKFSPKKVQNNQKEWGIIMFTSSNER